MTQAGSCSKELKTVKRNAEKVNETLSQKKFVRGSEIYEPKVFDDLPIKVLANIFEYLPLRCKKNMKLVCKRWYESSYLMREKLVFDGVYGLDSIIEILTSSQRRKFNLEFINVNFEGCSTAFWKTCGKKVHSLNFADCVLGTAVAVDMMTYCDNLTSLSWHQNDDSTGTGLCSTEVIDSLVQENLINNNLTLLEIVIYQHKWLKNRILPSLFSLFPKIEKLSIRCEQVQTSTALNAEPQHRQMTNFYSKLESIQGLDLRPPSVRSTLPSHLWWETIISTDGLHLTHLKEIGMRIDTARISLETVAQFLCKQNLLEIFNCEFVRSAGSINQLFIKLLENCSRLKRVDLSSREDILLVSSYLFERIVVSALNTLSFCFELVSLDPEINAPSQLNRSLSSLAVRCECDERTQIAFVSRFRNLKHLILSGATDAVLRTVWEFQPNLLRLELLDLMGTTDYGFAGRRPEINYADGCSIRKLQKLQQLTIRTNLSHDWCITSQSLREFVFPELTYLFLDVECDKALKMPIMETIRSMPSLETLWICRDCTFASEWFQVCSKLKNLRYMNIFTHQYTQCNSHWSLFLGIFDCCPSLRLIVNRTIPAFFDRSSRSFVIDANSEEGYVLFYHVLQKKVERCSLPSKSFKWPR